MASNETTLAQVWQRLKPFVLPYKKQYLLGFLPIPLSVFCSIAFPWLIIEVIDQQLVPKQWDGMGLWITLLGAVLMLNYSAIAMYSYFVQKAALYSMNLLREDMLRRVFRFPRSYFDKTPMGSVLTRLTSDIEAINESLASGLLAMVRDVLITFALLIFLTTISWQLTLVTLVIAPPIYWVTSQLRRLLQQSQLNSRRVLSQSTGYLQENLQGMKTVQLYNAEAEVQQKFSGYTQAFFRFQSKSNLIDAVLFAVIEGIMTISTGLLIWYGANDILTAGLTVGVLIGFIQTLDKIFVPVRDFTSQIATIQRALAAVTNINHLYEQPLESETETQFTGSDDALQRLKDRLENFEELVFDQVSFRYLPTSQYVLKNVSFTLKKGEKFALVGTTGSGKSTILRLLTKTYMDYEGSIQLNGIELGDIPKALIADVFSLMQQEIYLFNESIAFNIGLGRPACDRQAIQAAAKYVYADEFIEKLPNGYDFVLTENGGNLSTGQGQLLAFARAMSSGSDLVLLDEATSAVDSVTENRIQRAIDKVFADKTVIAIAHRLSTIQYSDQIIVLDQGKIIEQGSHESLVALDGFYAQLLSGGQLV